MAESKKLVKENKKKNKKNKKKKKKNKNNKKNTNQNLAKQSVLQTWNLEHILNSQN